ncbi:MAG: S-layer homology domain-containing protein [Clostridia bacterium]|nr:S-layer homology domain-containing protein [Clostridia bacterium]
MRRFLGFVLTLMMLLQVALPTGLVGATTPDVVFDITAPATAMRGETVIITVSAEVSADTELQGLQADLVTSNNFPDTWILDETKIVTDELGCNYSGITPENFTAVKGSPFSAGALTGQVAFTIPQNAAYDTVYTLEFDYVEAATASALSQNYTIRNQQVSIKVVPLPSIAGLTVNAFEGTYDGQEHGVLDYSCEEQGVLTMKFSADGQTYGDDAPVFTNAGQHTIYYVGKMEGRSDTYGQAIVKIDPKLLTPAMVQNIPAQPYTGSQIIPTVTVVDDSPCVVTTEDYEVTYGNNVTVAEGGSVTVTAKGNYTGQVTKTFAISPIAMTVEEEGYTGTYDGLYHKATVTVKAPLTGATIKYGQSQGSYTLDTMPEYKDAGTHTVYYKVTADNYLDYEDSVQVVIQPKALDATMVGDISDFDYTGTQITPAVTVTDDSTLLIQDEDYTVRYGNNVNVAEGGSVTVVGTGNYTGEATKSFAINPIAMTVESQSYTGIYDGAEHSGSVVVTVPNTAVIQYGTENGVYNLTTIPKYKNVGTYQTYFEITDPNYITYQGSIEIAITAKTLTEAMVQDIEAQDYTGQQIIPTVTIADESPCVITADDYTIRYGNNVTVAEGGSVTITAKGNYTGEVTKSFTIKPIPMTVETANYTGIFDGLSHQASVSVTTPVSATVVYGMTAGTYDLTEMPSFTDVTNTVVYYKATAENYMDNTGSVQVVIQPKAVNAAMIGEILAQDYTGQQITPAITVTDDSTPLIQDEDYTVRYGNNVNVAEGGSVTITGKGNYTGEATKNFTINPIDMTVESQGYTGTFDGNEYSGSVVVTTPNTAVIKYGTEEGTYNLTAIPKYRNAGTYQTYFEITDPNYITKRGSIEIAIGQKTLTDAMVEEITPQEFTGLQLTPAVTVRDNGLITIDDYTVSYGNNVTVAEGGTVTITGKGNYTGEVTKEFEIARVILRATATDYQGTFDGLNHQATVTVTNNSEAVLRYGMTEGTYDLTEMPTFTNAGEYVVYYKATAENYSDCIGSATVTISPKALTEAMVGDVANATYTSAPITPDVTVADGELLTAEDCTVTYGNNVTVAEGGSVTVTAKRNYTGEVTKNFAIEKAPLEITSESKTITYGDAFEFAVNYSGFVGAETKANLTSEAVVSGYSQNPDAGVYNLTLQGAEADNYSITYGEGYTLTVNKKDVTITALTVFDKLYDETTDAVINEGSVVFEGILSGDVVMLDLTGVTATFATAEVGDNIAVTISGLALKGEEGGNYQLTDTTFQTTASIKATISAAELAAQITAITVDRNATKLQLPTLPEGYTATIKSSSDEAVLDLAGNIVTGNTDTNVTVVLTISNEDGTETADTAEIAVVIPAHDTYQITVTAEANGTATGGGTYVKNQTVTLIATPASGYAFAGWYQGTTLVSSLASYSFAATENLTLVAKFATSGGSFGGGGGGGGGAIAAFTVKFVTNGGDAIKDMSVKANATIGSVPTPVKEGYTFVGWYTDKALTTPFDQSAVIKKAVTLYAKWEKVQEVPPVEPQLPAFSDVSKGDWYFDAVQYVVEKGLFKGVSETTFAPESSLTRAMLVTVLYRAENQPEIAFAERFDDVKVGEYYSDAVVWAAQTGIVSGISETAFAPNENITREQIAAIIYRYAKFKGMDGTISGTENAEYKDASAISDWAADSVAFCKKMKIMSGNDLGQFKPLANATRAEVAATLQRFFQGK